MDLSLVLWGVVLFLVAFLLYRRVKQFRELTKPVTESEHPTIITLSEQNFAKHTSTGLILVDFWASWCGPCRVVGPIVVELAEKFEGRVKVGKLNVDEHPSIASKFGIRSIPTLILFKDGKIVERLVGVRPLHVLEKLLHKHLSSVSEA